MSRLCVLALLLLLAACQSIETDVASSVAPEYRGHTYSRLCVSSPEGDLRVRRAAEEALAEELTKLGVECMQLGEILFAGKEYGEEEVRSAVEESGAEGYLTIVSLQTWVDEYYVPPSVSTSGTYGWHGHPYGWGYSTTWVSGGYTISRPRATYDVRLVDVATEDVAWVASVGVRGTTETSWADMRSAAAKRAVSQLVEDGVLAVKRPQQNH